MFRTTRWELVSACNGGDAAAREALQALCAMYREPVLAFVRRSGHSGEDAEDLAQGFFLEFIERRMHASANPVRGRFRSYLLGALRHYLSHAAARARAQRRGGAIQVLPLEQQAERLAAPGEDPEQAFERAWARVVLRRAMAQLHAEARAAGKEQLLEAAMEFLVEPPAPRRYAEVAACFGMRRSTFAVAVHRLRERLHVLLRAEAAGHGWVDTAPQALQRPRQQPLQPARQV